MLLPEVSSKVCIFLCKSCEMGLIIETGQHMNQCKLWKRVLALKVKIFFAFHSISLFSQDCYFSGRDPHANLRLRFFIEKSSHSCFSVDV